jgi:uncharacterized protein (TIGR00725 family)
VIGASDATSAEVVVAEEVGGLLAEAGCVLVCGGLGGVMEAAARGCDEAGGIAVGLLPGADPAAGNRFLRVVVPTGIGEARNALVVGAAEAVIAIGGGFGTLSEIALAARTGTPIIGIDTWSPRRPGTPDPVIPAASAREAVDLALHEAAARRA